MARFIFPVSVAVLLLLGCRATEPEQSFAPSPADDAAVISAALRAFAVDPDAETFGVNDRTMIALHHQTVEHDGMIGGNQFPDVQGVALPRDAVAHLRERHEGTVELRSLPVDEDLIVWIDLDELPRGLRGHVDFLESYPDVRAWVNIWLPGYTSDGTRAVLRFWFGPTPHGATATYLLERNDAGAWVVVDRSIAYYQ